MAHTLSDRLHSLNRYQKTGLPHELLSEAAGTITLMLSALKDVRTELGITDDFIPFAVSAELCGKIERAIAVAEGRAR